MATVPAFQERNLQKRAGRSRKELQTFHMVPREQETTEELEQGPVLRRVFDEDDGRENGAVVVERSSGFSVGLPRGGRIDRGGGPVDSVGGDAWVMVDRHLRRIFSAMTVFATGHNANPSPSPLPVSQMEPHFSPIAGTKTEIFLAYSSKLLALWCNTDEKTLFHPFQQQKPRPTPKNVTRPNRHRVHLGICPSACK